MSRPVAAAVLRSGSLALLCAALLACGSEQPAAPVSVPAPEPAAAGASAGAAASAIETAPMAAAEDATVLQFEAGKSWTLQGASLESLNSANTGIFIEVQEGRVVGYGGCNRFSVPISRGKAGELAFDAVVSSKRACGSAALNAAEREFLQSLAAVTAFEISQGELQLRTADGTTLRFSEGRPNEAEPPSE